MVSFSQVEVFRDRYRLGTEVKGSELKGKSDIRNVSPRNREWVGKLRLLADLIGILTWNPFDL